MGNLIQRYMQLPRHILNLVAAGLLVNIVSAGFILILNIYMRKEGFVDEEIAAFTSYRFLGVLVLAFPLGLFIKGKPLKPFFLSSAIIMPISGVLMMYAVDSANFLLIKSSFLMWGVGLMLLQVCTLPFIMRNTPAAVIPEAISLSFATWSFSLIFTGIFIAVLTSIGSFRLGSLAFQWTEYEILLLLVCLSSFSIYFVWRLEEGPPRTASSSLSNQYRALRADYDWDKILKALVPTMLIAVGAGLMIPFVSLFFYSVFQVDSDQFSLIGSLAAGLGVVASLMIPAIKRNFGYNVAILATQSAAILFLIMLACTQLFAQVQGMVFLAICFYVFRQPLMHMAAPITSELTMNYVGEKNQELISAINSSIWSASWYISAKLFQFMRSMDVPYYRIFLITAGLYTAGVIMYYFIIREYEGMNQEADNGPTRPLSDGVPER